METFDLYGFEITDLDALAKVLSEALHIEWIARRSSYLGAYYKARNAGESLTLRHNYNDEENDWMEPQHTDFPVLLYVVSQRGNEIKARLEQADLGGIRLLRRRTADELDEMGRKSRL